MVIERKLEIGKLPRCMFKVLTLDKPCEGQRYDAMTHVSTTTWNWKFTMN